MKTPATPEVVIQKVLSDLTEARALFDFDFKIKHTDNSVEFCCQLDAIIEQLEAERERHHERLAIQAIDDGLTTTERAINALKRPERFKGEWDVARAWLKSEAPNTRVFMRSAE
jgi:hypothetical protein